MTLTFEKLNRYTEKNIQAALGAARLIKAFEGMSIDFPEYEHLLPGSYEEGEFVTLFLDIRGSTKRAFDIGAKKTFVTMQGLLPTLALIVNDLDGFIVDYPGDGIMAHWKIFSPSVEAIQNSILAAGWMDDAVKNIVNPILGEYDLPPLTCGIGVSQGPVIITKIGIPSYFSAKAIGNSINFASKLASREYNSGKILTDLKVASIAARKFKVSYTRKGPSVACIEPNYALKIPRIPLAVYLLKKINGY